MNEINQIPLWCRKCDEPYTAFDENGVCDNCGAPNILERHYFPVNIPVDSYTPDEARAFISVLLEELITHGFLPEDTELV